MCLTRDTCFNSGASRWAVVALACIAPGTMAFELNPVGQDLSRRGSPRSLA